MIAEDDKTTNENIVHAMYQSLEISGLNAFTAALNEHKILYIEARYPQDYKEENKRNQPLGIAEGFSPAIGITTLEEYFAHIVELSLINRKYTVLPLDEPYFEINANTRAISVPAEFKKNGVAVQGDDLAEVLYFKIDRYFDYMDLNNCEIFIQWETPKAADGTIVKSASSAYMRDIESEPGKLIFGWVLDDSITAASGNLKFSIRFFQWDPTTNEPVLAYSLSTLTASVTIHPSIAFNPETDDVTNIDDIGIRLLERLENSTIVGGYSAAEPEFIINLLDKEDYEYDFDAENGTTLKVLAFAPDTGSISYSWRKQELDANNNTTDQPITRLENKNLAVPVEKTRLLDNRLVYYTNEGLTDVFGSYELTDDQITSEEFKLYTRYASYVIPVNDEDDDTNDGQTGVYWAIATNRITNSSKPKDSFKAIFPRPKTVVVETAPPAAGILNNSQCELSVIVEEKDDTTQKKSYKWYRDGELKHEGGAESYKYIATESGYYTVEITNSRNGAKTSTFPMAGEVVLGTRVTLPAAEPTYVMPAVTDFKFANLATEIGKCPSIEINAPAAFDKLVVDWYTIKTGATVDADEPVLITSQPFMPGDALVSIFNPLNFETEIRNATDGDLAGVYYPVVKNYLNCTDVENSLPVGSVNQSKVPEKYSEMFTVNY